MTNKEIDIQRALGTLPLWRQIELGDIKLKEIPNSMGYTRILFSNRIIIYNPTQPGDKAKAIRSIVAYFKNLGI